MDNVNVLLFGSNLDENALISVDGNALTEHSMDLSIIYTIWFEQTGMQKKNVRKRKTQMHQLPSN